MKIKIEDIPHELYTDYIAPCLTDKSLKSLTQSNRLFYNVFQPKRLIGALLNYVAQGKQDEAERILKHYPELMLEPGSVIDPSGRHFKHISAFELCLWTLDVRYMGEMLLNCIPDNEKGFMIKKALLLQFKNIEMNGVTYIFENKTFTEAHFDFKPLINGYETYIKTYDDLSGSECVSYWCSVIGKEQTKLPMHVRHHYCDQDVSFSPIPTFDKKELKRGLRIYNWVIKGYQLWDTQLAGLGIDFGIYRAHGTTTPSAVNRGRADNVAKIDCEVIRSLFDVRTKDLGALKERLLTTIQNLEDKHNPVMAL